MRRQTADAYKHALRAVKKMVTDIWPNRDLRPIVVHVDFDRAAIIAFEIVFRDDDDGYIVRLAGCFFHLKQAYVKRIEKLQLFDLYRDNADFRQIVSMLGALSLLAPDEVRNGLFAIREHASTIYFGQHASKVKALFDYVERNWVGTEVKAARMKPELWCCGDLIEKDFSRTNSPIEGTHADLHAQVGTKKPSLWRMLLKLHRMQLHTEHVLDDIRRGRPPYRRRHAKWEAVWKATRNVMRRDPLFDFNSVEIAEQIEYLKDLSAATVSVFDTVRR